MGLDQAPGTLELTALGREQPILAENSEPCKGILSKGPGLTRGNHFDQDLLESACFSRLIRVRDRIFQDLHSMLTPSGRGEPI